jgi:diguanylate cyclase (GGDEF)-like protein
MDRFYIAKTNTAFVNDLTTPDHIGTALGLSALAGIALWLSGFWGSAFYTAATLWLIGLVSCSLGLWIWFHNQQQGMSVTASNTLNSIFFNFYALFWFSVGPVFFQTQSPQTNILIFAIAVITSNSLLDLHCASNKFRQLFLLGVSTPLFISLLNDLAVHFLVSISLAAIGGLMLQRKQIVLQVAKQSSSSSQPPAAASSLETPQGQLLQPLPSWPIGFLQWDSERRLVNLNEVAAGVFKIGSKPILGSHIDQLISSQGIFLMSPDEFDQLLSVDNLSHDVDEAIKNNVNIICKWYETDTYDSRGNFCGGSACLENVTEQIKMIVKIRQRAYFDLLTGLPNRFRLTEEMARVLSLAQRTGTYCALLFIDLDHFKEINDHWGHNHGDSLLVLFAQRLRKVIRTQETVARLGGDEFVALLEGLGNCEQQARAQVAQVAEKIVAIARTEFTVNDQNLQIGCSIGITLFNDASLSSDNILDQADKALYKIKRNGRSNYNFYRPAS